MAKKFSELRAKMTAEAREESAREAQRILSEMPLTQLRAARELTQTQLAKILDIDQSEVSRMEKRTDMYVSTLASYVAAMGGTLELRAVFPHGDVVRITQFEDLDEKPAKARSRT